MRNGAPAQGESRRTTATPRTYGRAHLPPTLRFPPLLNDGEYRGHLARRQHVDSPKSQPTTQGMHFGVKGASALPVPGDSEWTGDTHMLGGLFQKCSNPEKLPLLPRCHRKGRLRPIQRHIVRGLTKWRQAISRWPCNAVLPPAWTFPRCHLAPAGYPEALGRTEFP